MKCPHCLENFHTGEPRYGDIVPAKDNAARIAYLGEDADCYWWLESTKCPACDRLVLHLIGAEDYDVWGGSQMVPEGSEERLLVRPKMSSRSPVPPEVPEELASDYLEACLVLGDSPKASAALSRRGLQHILREKAGVNGRTLYDEIEQAKAQGDFPSGLVQLLDVPRQLGNIAAHPLNDPQTGSIVDVEPWEAEWCLEVIEALYDHYFVIPARNAERLSRLQQKKSP